MKLNSFSLNINIPEMTEGLKISVCLMQVIFQGSVCLRRCWLSILARIITLKDHSNLIKRFFLSEFKRDVMYVVADCCLLEWSEAAGRNQEEVVLFPCQIIDTGTDCRRGWTTWTAGHSICQIQACCLLWKVCTLKSLHSMHKCS